MCKKRATEGMFAGWRHQKWSYAIRWKIWVITEKKMAVTSNIIKGFCLFARLVRGNKRNEMIKTYSLDSNVRILDESDHDLTCVWPGLGQGHVWAQIPKLHSHIFVTAGQGRRLSYLRPSQIHNISHCASVSPGFPLWLLTKEDDGEEKDRGVCVCACVRLNH